MAFTGGKGAELMNNGRSMKGESLPMLMLCIGLGFGLVTAFKDQDMEERAVEQPGQTPPGQAPMMEPPHSPAEGSGQEPDPPSR
jgi:hypothetical protein